jgi:hypothetical protein
MGSNRVIRFLPDLNFAEFDDQDRHTLVAGIGAVASTSHLVTSSPAMQASLAQLVVKDAALAQANVTVGNDRQKLRTDIATETTARGVIDGEIRTFATLTGNTATSPEDVHSVGLVYRPPTPRGTPPQVPTGIDNKPPTRGHGKTTVSVHETGTVRQRYVAESSPDPFGPTTWAPLGVGLGKTRVVTGVSGTKVWVRFAAVRGQLQSDWCTAVLITIP